MHTNSSLESDWARVDSLTDEEIDTSDIAPLSGTYFRRARIRMPKQSVSIEIDEDLLKWFSEQGDDYHRQINAALRIYVEAHRAA